MPAEKQFAIPQQPCLLGSPPSEKDPLLPQTTQQVDAATTPAPSSDLHGYFLMCLSTIGFSGSSFFTHIAEHTYSFPATSSACIRGTVHTLFATVYLISFLPVRALFSRLTPHQRRTLIFRGFVGAIDVCFLLMALRLLPVGDAVTIFFCSPVITMLMSHYVLSEPFSRLELLAGIICFSGVALISRPGSGPVIDTTDRLLGSFCAFAAAVLSSMVFVAVRSMGTGVHFMVSVLSLSVATILVSAGLGGALSPAGLVRMKEGALAALGAALFSFSGQCFLNKALQLCRAGPGTLIRNLDVPITYLLGLLFLGEKPSWFSLVGSCLVLTGTLMIGVLQLLRS